MGGRAQRTKSRDRDLEDGEICAEVMTERVVEWVMRQIEAGATDKEQRQMDRLLVQTDFIAAIVRGEKG